MAIEGPLKELNIHDVFQLLDLSRKTGVLRVRSELRQNAGTVYFERGAVVGAQIRTNPHPLGGVLLAAGKISPEDLTRARAVQHQGDPRRLGEILVGIGAVSARELQRQVRAQVEEVIFELMGWSEGYFSFEEGEGPADTEADVRITTEALLMEAARRIDEWSRIEGKIPNLAVVPRLGPQAGEGGTLDLQPLEWEILAVLDGTRDVKTISETLGRSDFDVAKSLYGLACAGIVLLEAPAAVTPMATGRELAITIAQADDLLAAGDFPAALAGAQSAAAAHPKEAVSHLMVGRVLLAMGRAQESAESFRRAIQLDPLGPPAYRLLGNSLAAQGHFREAMDAWERWEKLGDKAPEEAALAPGLLQARDAVRVLEGLSRRPSG